MSIRQNLWLLSFASPFFAILLASDTQAASPAVEKRLAELKQAYEAAVECQAGTAANAAIKALDAKYTAALDRFIINSTQAGKLEEAIALRDEKKRVSDAPQALKPLRGTYRSQLAEIEAAREKQISPLKERYLQELTKLQTDTTKTGNLEDALAVKTVIDGMGKAVSPSQAPDESPGKPVIAKGNGKTDPKAAQAICEWALANGAVVETSVGKVGLNTQLRVAPKGNYKVRALWLEENVSEFPWDLLSGLGELAELKLKFVSPPAPESFKALASLPHLDALSLTDPLKFTDLTVDQVMMMPSIPTLTKLQFVSRGKLREVLPLLIQRFPNVANLDVYGVEDIEQKEFMELTANWNKITKLRVQCNLSVEAGLELIKLPNLEEVMFFTGSYKLDPKALSSLNKIKIIQINGRTESPDLLPILGTLGSLVEISVAMEKQSPDSLSHLSALPNLRKLTVTKMPEGMDLAAQSIASRLKLTELSLITGDLSDAGASAITAMKQLQRLEVPGTKLGDTGLLALSKLKELDVIDVTGTQVTEAGIKAFQKARPRCQVIH